MNATSAGAATGAPSAPTAGGRAMSLRCDLRGMVKHALHAMDQRRDPHGGTRAGLEQLLGHIDQVRSGKASVAEFADFYLLQSTTLEKRS
jgi:hypothetical protein